jgi:hypothetical protein
MRVSPLFLSQEQLTVVLDHAKLVPPQWHGAFLNDVADRLLSLNGEISNDTVRHAVQLTLRRMGVERAA